MAPRWRLAAEQTVVRLPSVWCAEDDTAWSRIAALVLAAMRWWAVALMVVVGHAARRWRCVVADGTAEEHGEEAVRWAAVDGAREEYDEGLVFLLVVVVVVVVVVVAVVAVAIQQIAAELASGCGGSRPVLSEAALMSGVLLAVSSVGKALAVLTGSNLAFPLHRLLATRRSMRLSVAAAVGTTVVLRPLRVVGLLSVTVGSLPLLAGRELVR